MPICNPSLHGQQLPPLWDSAASATATVTLGPQLTPDVRLITTAQDLQAELATLCAAARIGLDIETTGLDPRTHHVRTVQLALLDRTIIVDAYQCPLALLSPLLQGPTQFVTHCSIREPSPRIWTI